jgi:hypothetical protein
MNDAARSVPFLKLRILRIEIALRLFLGVEMVEVAEELIEAMIGRQMLVMIAEMVLAKLTGGVALCLQGVRNCWHPFGNAVRISWHADRQEASTERLLAKDKCRSPRRAALLAIRVNKDRAFSCDAVNVWRSVAHHAHGIGADLGYADVVAENDQDVRLLSARRRRRLGDWACAIRTVPLAVIVDAAASVVPPSRTLRRLIARVLRFSVSSLFGILSLPACQQTWLVHCAFGPVTGFRILADRQQSWRLQHGTHLDNGRVARVELDGVRFCHEPTKFRFLLWPAGHTFIEIKAGPQALPASGSRLDSFQLTFPRSETCICDARRTEGWGDHDADCCRSRCGTWSMSVPRVATFLGWARDDIGPICDRKRSEFLAPGLLRQLVGGTPDAGLVLDDDVMNLKGDWEFAAQAGRSECLADLLAFLGAVGFAAAGSH